MATWPATADELIGLQQALGEMTRNAGSRLLAGVTSSGPAGGPYLPTLLALCEGPLLEQAVRALPIAPERPRRCADR